MSDRRQQTAVERRVSSVKCGINNTPHTNDHTPETFSITHLFQAPGIDFAQPQAAQLHIYYTMRSLQNAGHDVRLLALVGQQVINTSDLRIFYDKPAPSMFGQLGLAGRPIFRLFERGVRRIQKDLRLPYLALFDSLRFYDAVRHTLPGLTPDNRFNQHIIHERFNLMALGGALASRRLDVPFVLEVNADLLQQRRAKGKPERGLRRLWARWATRFCFNSADVIVTVSAGLARHLQQEWDIPAQRLAALPCAADTERFARAQSVGPEERRLQTIEGTVVPLSGQPVIMWIGGFHHWHDLELLLDSFTNVRQQTPDALLVLVGDGATRTQIQQRVHEQGLAGSVIMTGMIPHHRIPHMMALADILVAPSPALPPSKGGTGTPLKLFEYMAAGKAILATDVDQATAVLEHDQTALLTPPGDARAFAAAITCLLQDPARRARLGANARRQAQTKHSWEEYASQLTEIYRRLL